MNDAEIAQLYEKIDNELENLEIGKVREYEYPEFTKDQLMTIPKIIKYLQDKKYKGTLKIESPSAMKTKVTKVQPQETEKSVFDPSNLTFEKSDAEIQAEQAYINCVSNNHELVQSNQTTFRNPILTCKQCKLGYTYKLNSGTTKVKTVFQIK